MVVLRVVNGSVKHPTDPLRSPRMKKGARLHLIPEEYELHQKLLERLTAKGSGWEVEDVTPTKVIVPEPIVTIKTTPVKVEPAAPVVGEMSDTELKSYHASLIEALRRRSQENP